MNALSCSERLCALVYNLATVFWKEKITKCSGKESKRILKSLHSPTPFDFETLLTSPCLSLQKKVGRGTLFVLCVCGRKWEGDTVEFLIFNIL